MYSYQELACRVAFLVERLREAGVNQDSPGPVSFIAELTEDVVALLMALFELGVPAAPLHSRLTLGEQARAIAALRPSLHLDAPGLLGAGQATPSDGHAAPSARRPLVMLHTSGTAGEPKAAVLSASACLASAHAVKQVIGHDDMDRWLLAMPLAHVGGFSIIVRALAARTCVVLGSRRTFTPDDLLRSVERRRVTLISLVPTMLQRIVERPQAWTPPSFVRALLLGGAPATKQLLAAARAQLIPVLTTYGLTEAGSMVSVQRPRDTPSAGFDSGYPLPATEIRIVNGQIRVRGPTLMDGYHGAATSALIDGWLPTGDRGHLDSAGRLHVTGRCSDLIISGGENVSPTEVEHVLQGHPEIGSACVFSTESEEWGEVVCAAIVQTRPTQPLELAVLASYVRLNLAAHKRPRLVCFVRELAQNANGKVDRRLVKAAVSANLHALSAVLI